MTFVFFVFFVVPAFIVDGIYSGHANTEQLIAAHQKWRGLSLTDRG